MQRVLRILSWLILSQVAPGLSGDLSNTFFAVADFIVTALRCDLFIQARLTVVGSEVKG